MSSSHFTINGPQAINLGVGGPQIYDSRAAVYEKQGMTKEALLEAKKVIDLYPHSWQVSSVLPSQAIGLTVCMSKGIRTLCSSLHEDQ
jgi:hypothetical protein